MFDRKLISISIASALLTSSLAVSANTQKDKEEDSVKAWGPWAQQYATAAGGEFNTNALAFASLGQSETGRNAQNEAGFGSTSVEGLCEAGQVCAITSFYAHNPLGDEADQFATGTTGIKKMDNLSGGEVIVYDVDGTELYRFSRGNTSGQVYFSDINRTMDLDGAYASGFASLDGGEGVGDGVWFETAGDYWAYGGGAWGHSQRQGGTWPLNGIGGFYVAGVASTIDVVESLVGQVGLTYTGSTYNGTDVTINLDMGNRTWDASFEAKDVVAEGRYRNTSFGVSGGTIQGVNLYASSEQLSSGVTGEVQAAFFGSSANQIAGVLDIEKSGMEYTDSFVSSLGEEQVAPEIR